MPGLTQRIAMWSGPRNLSTALMRSWESRPDCAVSDEPLYGYYLRETGAAHPGAAEIIEAMETDWRAVVATLKEASVEFEMVWDTADAGFGAVKDAYLNNAPIGMQILDGSSSGAGEGLQADFMITSFSRSEALEEAIGVSVTAKPTYADNAPEWMTIP